MFFKLKNIQKSLFLLGGSGMFMILSNIFKISPILGSKFSFFSWANVGIPALASFGAIFPVLAFALRFGFRFFLLPSPSMLSGLYIPTVCATYYWSQSEQGAQRARWFALIIPVISTVLFVLHPVGNVAALYTIYWVIPVILQIKKTSNIVTRAVTSTFIAHAVGSVIWLYTGPSMTAAEWLSLLPVVPVERICFAAIMVGVYYIVEGIRSVVVSTIEKGYAQQ